MNGYCNGWYAGKHSTAYLDWHTAPRKAPIPRYRDYL
jgi:hypothetical protein